MIAAANVRGGGGAADAERLEQALREAFELIDEDGGGTLEIEELAELFKREGMDRSDDETKEIMGEIMQIHPDSLTGDEGVTFERFASWLLGSSVEAETLRNVLTAKLDGGGALDLDRDNISTEQRAQHECMVWTCRDPGGEPDAGVRQTIFVLLEEPESSRVAFWVSCWVQFLIFISTVTFVLETVQTVRERQSLMRVMAVIEVVCILSFTAEWATRAVTCSARPGSDKRVLPYLLQPLNLIDVVSICPFYIELLLASGGSLAVLRVIRMVRVFRVLKVGTYALNLRLVLVALDRSKSALLVFVYMLFVFMVVTASGVQMFEVGEDKAAPRKGFESIPAVFWFVIVTMTSVGYGDVFPVTSEGKLVTVFIMLCGILVLAIPVTVIGHNFHEVWGDAKRERLEKALRAEMRAMVLPSGGGEVTPRTGRPVCTPEETIVRLGVVATMVEQALDRTKEDCLRQCLELVRARELELSVLEAEAELERQEANGKAPPTAVLSPVTD